MRALALAGAAALAVLGTAAAMPLWGTALAGAGILALVPLVESPPARRRRPAESPEARRRRIYRYRLVYAERYGQGPERLNECPERLS